MPEGAPKAGEVAKPKTDTGKKKGQDSGKKGLDKGKTGPGETPKTGGNG